MIDKLTRRTFLRTASLAAPFVVSARALGQADKVAANERIALGFIGIGGMGNGHLGGFLGNRRTEVLAVCDVDTGHRERAAARVGEGCAQYTDYRELLDRSDIDAVVIATPDHWHTLPSIHACQAGKDVYCEKPLTLTIEESSKLVTAVRRYDRVFQTGSQQRSSNEFQRAVSLVRAGRIGKVHTVKVGIGAGPSCGYEASVEPPEGLDWNLWLGPAPYVPYTPKRCHSSFRWFWDYSGGKMTDWGHHHNDIAQWGLNMDGSGPVRIAGTATFPSEGLYETAVHFDIHYEYADGTRVICGDSNRHGITFEGPDGWVFVARGMLETSPSELADEPLGSGDIGFVPGTSHQNNWLDCIESRERPVCDAEIGASSVRVCHLGNIAIRTGRALNWDPSAQRFIGDEGANRWLSRPYRAPWSL